jgi:hypothetical protein
MSEPRASIPPDPLLSPMGLAVEERPRRFNWLETKHVGSDGVARVPPEFVVEQGRSVLIIDTRAAAERKALFGAVEVLGERQRGATLGHLAPGLPRDAVKFRLDGSFTVRTVAA